MFLKPISASPAGKSHTINSSYQIRFFRIVEKIQFEGGDFYHRKGLLSGGKGGVYDPEYESDIKANRLVMGHIFYM